MKILERYESIKKFLKNNDPILFTYLKDYIHIAFNKIFVTWTQNKATKLNDINSNQCDLFSPSKPYLHA